MRAPAVLLLLASLGLSGCLMTRLSSGERVTAKERMEIVAFDVVTFPAQVVGAGYIMIKEPRTSSIILAGKPSWSDPPKQESPSASLNQNPRQIFDKKWRDDLDNQRTYRAWYRFEFPLSGVTYSDAEWKRLAGLAEQLRIDDSMVNDDKCPMAFRLEAVERLKRQCKKDLDECSFPYAFNTSVPVAILKDIAEYCPHRGGRAANDMLRRAGVTGYLVAETTAEAAERLRRTALAEASRKRAERFTAMSNIASTVNETPALVTDPEWQRSPANMEALCIAVLLFDDESHWRETVFERSPIAAQTTPRFSAEQWHALLSEDYPWKNWPDAPVGDIGRQLVRYHCTWELRPSACPESEMRALIERLGAQCTPSRKEAECPLRGLIVVGQRYPDLRAKLAEQCVHETGNRFRALLQGEAAAK